MSESKFTPGPWYVGGKYTVRISISSSDWICRTRDNHHGHIDIEDEANARLIAAAPDMYEAIKKTLGLDASEGYWLHPDAVKSLCAAIAKAEGRHE